MGRDVVSFISPLTATRRTAWRRKLQDSFGPRNSHLGTRLRFHQVLEYRLQVVVRRRHLFDRPQFAARLHDGPPRVEPVPLSRPDLARPSFDPDTADILPAEARAREAPLY